tara:strand:+ start:223 stop:417 length:195 start_codon:yes stop_codon:yes gene_type:complete
MTWKDYEWYIETDFSKYGGKWIAILDQKVVVSDKSLKNTLKYFRKQYPKKTPTITKVNNKLSIY